VFVGFYEVSETTGKVLATVAEDCLLRFGLSFEHLRFQSYDVASNMSGTFKGCQAMIKEKQPLGLYVHCGAHVTHLISSFASEATPLIRDTLQFVQDLGTFLKSSMKIRKYLKCPEDMPVIVSEESAIRIKPLCPTRWLSRCNSIRAVLQQYSLLMLALESKSRKLAGELACRSRGFLKHLQESELLLGFEIALVALPLIVK